jgi:hypothetical protein
MSTASGRAECIVQQPTRRYARCAVCRLDSIYTGNTKNIYKDVKWCATCKKHVHDDDQGGRGWRKIHEMFPSHLTCHDIVKTTDGREIWRPLSREAEGAGKQQKNREYSVCSSHPIVKRLKEIQREEGGAHHNDDDAAKEAVTT